MTQLAVIADCRVTWRYPNGKSRLQDNLQKIYQFGPTGIIGFADSVLAAKVVFNSFNTHPLKTLPPNAWGFVEYIVDTARAAFNTMQNRDGVNLELSYTAMNYGKVYRRLQNATLAEPIMVSFNSPDFEPVRHVWGCPLGFARELDLQPIVQEITFLNQFGLNPAHHGGQAKLAIELFGERVARQAGTSVGGLFTAGIVNADGVRWVSYSQDENYSIELRGFEFVQTDKKTDREIVLQPIVTFDENKPARGNLRIDSL
jgi:hypothetical protein